MRDQGLEDICRLLIGWLTWQPVLVAMAGRLFSWLPLAAASGYGITELGGADTYNRKENLVNI